MHLLGSILASRKSLRLSEIKKQSLLAELRTMRHVANDQLDILDAFALSFSSDFATMLPSADTGLGI